MKTALVFGGTGQIGAAVGEVLADSGWRVLAASRSGRRLPHELSARGVQPIDAREKPFDEVFGETGVVDAVVHPMVYDAEHAATLLAKGGRYGSLVVISTISVYADRDGRSLEGEAGGGFPDFGGPVHEDSPTVAAGPESYSSRKVAMEEALADAPVPVTILRPGAIHGRHSRHPREWWFLKRVLDGRKAIPVAYDGESVFQTTSATSIARLVEFCLRNPRSTTLNVADQPAPSVRDIARAIADATGCAVRLVRFAGPPVDNVGQTPWSVPLPFAADTSSAEALGWTPGNYAEDVADACSWIMDVAQRGDWKESFTAFADYGYDPFDYGAEDAFLARADKT